MTSPSFAPSAMPLGSAPQMTDWPGALDDRLSAGPLTEAISARLAALLRERTGRAPTEATAAMAGDLVVVTLADCLTPAERHLAECGHGELVTRARVELQRGMRAEASAIVEQVTGRRVNAYMSDQHHDPDMAIVVFFLASDPPLRRGARSSARVDHVERVEDRVAVAMGWGQGTSPPAPSSGRAA